MKTISFHRQRDLLFRLLIVAGALGTISVQAAQPVHMTLQVQQQKASGKVTDASRALPGATITNKNTGNITISDADGNFSINATVGDKLECTAIGYANVEVIYEGNSLSIIMATQSNTLSEVVVNAGYYTVKESERTGSIARITADDIQTQPVSNVLATMQGRMAGVHITQTTGVPGGGFDIQIRGLNSVRPGGNDPLYIIDGIPYSSEAIGVGQNSPILPTRPSPLNSLNPGDIQSIEVLKDADATAIYGSRGANGVVLVTTKRGRTGRLDFSARVSRGGGVVTNFMELLSTPQYLEMRREAMRNDGLEEIPDYAYDINGTWDENRYTDWQKELLGGVAEFSETRLSASGGSQNTSFHIGTNINGQTTVFPGDFRYRKSNVRAALNHRSQNDRFNLSFTTGYTAQRNRLPRTDLMITALSLPPNAPALYKEDGSLNWENGTWANPLGALMSKYESRVRDLLASGTISYEIMEGLTLKSAFGFTSLSNNETTANPSTRFDPDAGFGPETSTLIKGITNRESWTVEPQADYAREWGKLRFNAVAGATFQAQQSDALVQFGTGFASNSLIYNMASASTVTTHTSMASEYRYNAIFARANFNWDGRYIVNLTGRRDGSSRFGTANRYANFMAAGGAWLFSKEAFLENASVLSFGKLRASIGTTGSDQIGDYQYLDTFSSTGNNYGGTTGLQPVRHFNPNFRWETNRKLEAGLDIGLFNDRIFWSAAWFKNKSSNQLAGLPLPGTTGFTSMIANLQATVENSGTEFTVSGSPIKSKDFQWTVQLNASFLKNKLVKFPNLETSAYRNTYVIGEPLNIVRLYKNTGVDPETGIYTFEDSNGDGQLTIADKSVVADLNPKFFGGVSSTVEYKKIRLDFLFQFVKQQNYNERSFFNSPGIMEQQPVSVMNRWQNPGDISTTQLFTDGLNNDAFLAYDRYFQSDATVSDASYIRLKNISLSYAMNPKWLSGIGCRIFAEGQNLLTITNYRGADPEFKTSGYLPPLRVITAGMEFNF